MTISLIRTILLYSLIVLALRVMGKRQVGELEPSELVVAILISELAAVPMQDLGIPLLYGAIPIITLLSCEILISYLSTKNRKIRGFFCGKPSVVIDNGRIDQSELKKLRLGIEELCEELRLKNITDINTVRYAILETNGKLSTILFSPAAPPTREDLSLNPPDKGYVMPLISDGEIVEENLLRRGKTIEWLNIKLAGCGVSDIKRVFYMAYDDLDNVTLILREGSL